MFNNQYEKEGKKRIANAYWVIDLMLVVMTINKLHIDNKCENHYINWLKHWKTLQIAKNCFYNDRIEERCRKKLTKTSLEKISIIWEKIV